ncbi:GDSL esterase/lipase [Rhynchospora pubera]|uniref:GDSL esterase/lipase n=1 Tax=Rhynchospora pubera TaxID=906938 RepID=A0AAV8FBJ0_9POAL|nr:GDSL esterase/lipase [Rhynchospora pubera]
MAGPVRPVIVLFGSSIVQYSFGNGGWGAKLADIYSRQADVVLRGYEGWNSMQACQVLATVFPEFFLVDVFCTQPGCSGTAFSSDSLFWWERFMHSTS